jgi:hypothetical protein
MMQSMMAYFMLMLGAIAYHVRIELPMKIMLA